MVCVKSFSAERECADQKLFVISAKAGIHYVSVTRIPALRFVQSGMTHRKINKARQSEHCKIVSRYAKTTIDNDFYAASNILAEFLR